MNSGKGALLADLAWAKSGDGSGYLSVRQHLEDAHGVSCYVWDRFVAPSAKRCLAELTGLAVGDVRRLVRFVSGAHDLGKLTKGFQGKLSRDPQYDWLLSSIESAGYQLEQGPLECQAGFFPHALASAVIVADWLKAQGVKPRVARSIARIVEAHHGVPAGAQWWGQAQDVLCEYPAAWIAGQKELLGYVAELSEFEQLLPRLHKKLPIPAVQLITGMVIMSDWIASNIRYFPLTASGFGGQGRLAQGLERWQVASPWDARHTLLADAAEYFHQAFAWPPGRLPRAVQQAAFSASCQEEAGPMLLVIEAPTGEGKTEAALAAAHQCAASGGAHGVIFAAPTMATANALFSRVTDWAKRVVPGGSQAAVYLAHSKNNLVERYREFKFVGIGGDGQANGDEGTVVAMEWFAGPKTGLLANFSVATVDQVLMLALQTKHSMLRHLALAGKVVIIDEVHAYDSFTSEYLATTLEWLGMYQVPVILLSATLPEDKKQKFMAAYWAAHGGQQWKPQSDAYPLITVGERSGVKELEIPPGPMQIRVEVELLAEDSSALVELLGRHLVAGGTALVVCNTIRRAQDTFRELLAAFPGEVELFHSSFIAAHRVAKEERMVEELGPQSLAQGTRPYRKIYVATQVVEQSLDIDVDLLVSDMAPIDSLIQRVGRLWRHTFSGPDRLGPEVPRLFIRGLLSWDGVPVFDGGAAAVYDPLVLLASTRVVLEEWIPKGFERPAAVAPLVRETYAAVERASVADAPPGWQTRWQEAVEESLRQRAVSRRRSETFRIPSPHVEDYGALFARFLDKKQTASQREEAAIAQVRDAEPSIEVIPIVSGEYGYALWGSDSAYIMEDETLSYPASLSFASATVRLPARMTRFASTFDAVVTQLESETPVGWQFSPLLRQSLALRLDEDSTAVLAGFRVTYSAELGLEVEKAHD
ncbi:CRISPR-associated helicase Cas3' [Corynebacterium lizhenjunii]|uniref:CRISPR-associated helicase Cas3 n=1 Tax=Corynebacterium lizhenjunii TaxID=2709394 RepID=A0A7T0KDX8_9CORY|nr:CRISPR-associated helicase Cas3' [Corynebacterium lizhenjunii]QPK78817.1 CRISPR-associated helicase Cas3' [Corynebacterium lizhenjunii]